MFKTVLIFNIAGSNSANANSKPHPRLKAPNRMVNMIEDEKSENESDLSYCNRMLFEKIAPVDKPMILK